MELNANSHDTVVAIDPGTGKCGMALVRRIENDQVSVLWRRIVTPQDVPAGIRDALELSAVKMVVVGNGTKSKDIVHTIRDAFPSIGILVIDERDTSLQARERYWEHFKRKGWRRLLPATLQVPPDPIDDFVAVILAERVLLAGL